MLRHSKAFLSSILIFAAWTLMAITPLMFEADRAISLSVHRFLSQKLQGGFSLVLVIGNFEVTVLLVLLTGAWLIRTGRTQVAVTLWALFVGGSIVELLAKYWVLQLDVPDSIRSPRLNLHGVPVLTFHTLGHILQAPYGYPSGHAFRLLLLAAVGWMAWRPIADRNLLLIRSLLIIGGALMGVMLVHSGGHQSSEVVGGYLLGAICIMPLSAAFGMPKNRSESTAHEPAR